jgi:hypothetical protein
MLKANRTRKQASGAFRSVLWNVCVNILLSLSAVTMEISSAAAQQPKPNILVIMGDDIGYWNISAYNRGMMGYHTPNIDRIANEGAIFTDYYGQQSCTAGRAAFISEGGFVRAGPDHCRIAQAAGLCDRTIRHRLSDGARSTQAKSGELPCTTM